ncbi:MAG: hypothetical protein K9N51_12130, partial [Candidatus Pacebacteria bacterium]|nr:hypothetical protein [Candidatus Paceibacterota bacterium]
MHHLLTLSALLGVLTIAVPNGLHGASPGGAFGDGRGNGILKVQLLTPDFENRANDEDAFYQHAGIEVDPDIQTFLQRAYTYAESHQYDTVARLLQKVVDDGRGTLLNVAPRVYRPADMAAIAMLTELPEDALDTYRILVD